MGLRMINDKKQPRKMNYDINVIFGYVGEYGQRGSRIPGYYTEHEAASRRMRKINDGFRALGKYPGTHAFLFPIPAIEEEGE